MLARLLCLDDDSTHDEILLEAFPCVIGRNYLANIRLDDPLVSRFHCKICEQGGRLVVWDLGSSNGTRVNGEHISESPLMPNDQLMVGHTTFLACYEPERPEIDPIDADRRRTRDLRRRTSLRIPFGVKVTH